ncbi:hypothetical protein V8E51_006147 [Hyaloscypha variabilis]
MATLLYDLSVPTFLQTVSAVGGFLDRVGSQLVGGERDLRIGRLYDKPRKNSDENDDGEGDGNDDELAFR